MKCDFTEEFGSYAEALAAWQVKGTPQSGPEVARVEKTKEASKRTGPKITRPSKEVEKIIEIVEPGVTRITIPTHYREDFNRYLTSRRIELSHPATTDVWNNIESAYTIFELLTVPSVAESIFDDWVAI